MAVALRCHPDELKPMSVAMFRRICQRIYQDGTHG